MQTPQTIGRYEVVAPLATGGMGELLLARERGPAGFERLVVVKRIRSQVAANPQFVDAFLREARLVARLNHPNIVQIIELGQLGEDEYFIAMEYIDGSTVEELQMLSEEKNAPIPLEVVVAIAVQSCRGLEVAHDLRDADGALVGLIHRDVSPQNLMCTTRGFVKLLDFGVAKTTTGIETTASGALKGKPGYFSPEQARSQPLDRRTDIFSLGAVLWELVAGEPLFQADGAFGTLRQVLDKPIPSLQQFGVDEAFDAIVQRALERDRDRRYPDASRLRADLSDYASTRGWRDLHDTLAEFVARVAKHVVERRQETTEVARTRELTASEGRSLVHRRSDTLVEAAPTTKLNIERMEDITAEDAGRVVSSPESADEIVQRPFFTAGQVAAFDTVILSLVFAVVFGTTIWRWVTPVWLPLIAFAAFVLVLGAVRFLGAAKGRRSRRLASVVLFGGLYTTLIASWLAPPARQAAAESVAAAGWTQPAGRALFDPSRKVPAAVCEGLERGGTSLPPNVVAQRLSSTDPDSAACLVTQLEPKSATTTVTLNYLLPRWTEDLLTATSDEDHDAVCQKAHWLARAVRAGGRDGDLSLLRCSIGAPSGAARSCCSQAYQLMGLGKGGVAAGLPPADVALEHGGAEIASQLAEMWSGQRDVDVELRQSLQLDSPKTRAWAIAVLCEGLATGEGRQVGARRLDALQSFVGGKCELPQNIQQEQAVWTSACQTVTGRTPFWEATGREAEDLCFEVGSGLGSVTLRVAEKTVATAFQKAVEVDEPGRTKAIREHTQKQCLEEGDIELCHKLGSFHHRNRDLPLALKFFEVACEGGQPDACNSAGYLLSVELKKSSPRRKGAMRFFERACSMGHSMGCANLAEQLKLGEIVKRDYKRARQIYVPQCEQGEGYACAGLALMHWNGEGMPRDPDGAIKLWNDACVRGYDIGCVDLVLDARTLDRWPSGIPTQKTLLRKGCVMSTLGACLYGIGKWYRIGRGVVPDQNRADRYFEWACEEGERSACKRGD